jgi:hypothetical protein
LHDLIQRLSAHTISEILVLNNETTRDDKPT